MEEEEEKYGVVGSVYIDSQEYLVRWIDQDTAVIEQDGDLFIEFCSRWSDGFHGQEDVLDQASDIAVEQELEDLGDFFDRD